MEPPAVRYLQTAEHDRIAVWECGEGPTLLHLPIGASHTQLDWADPDFNGWYECLAREFHLVGFDAHRTGLSSGRDWSTARASLTEGWIDVDLVAEALCPARFAVLGGWLQTPLAIEYAARRPDRVSHLILFEPLPRPAELQDPALDAVRAARRDAYETTSEMTAGMLLGWPTDDSARRFAALTLARIPTGADMASIMNRVLLQDASNLLGQLQIPTLVLHRRDSIEGLEAIAQETTASIPGAVYRVLPGGAVFPAFGPKSPVRDAIQSFIAQRPNETFTGANQSSEASPGGGDARVRSQFNPGDAALTRREVEVLALLAQGLLNPEIADRLSISRGTVARHVSNLLPKIDCRNRIEAARWAVDHGLVPSGE